jgi:hypothetical protein
MNKGIGEVGGPAMINQILSFLCDLFSLPVFFASFRFNQKLYPQPNSNGFSFPNLR